MSELTLIGIIGAVVSGIAAIIGAVFGYLITRGKQRSENAASDANTIGVLQRTIAEMQLGKSQLDNQFFELRLQVGSGLLEIATLKADIVRLVAENTALKQEVKDANARTVVAETALTEIKERLRGYPERIDKLEEIIRTMNNKAGNPIEQSIPTDAPGAEVGKQASTDAAKAALETGTPIKEKPL